MANKVITNVDSGSVEIRDGEFRDGVVTFAGADTYVAGTILAVLDAAPAGAWVLWDSGGAGGAEVAKAVLTADLEATGAGDVPARVLVAGVVNKNRLIEDGTGTGANVTEAVVRELQNQGSTALDVDQLGRVDNPQP
jgi:hypothetical protein